MVQAGRIFSVIIFGDTKKSKSVLFLFFFDMNENLSICIFASHCIPFT